MALTLSLALSIPSSPMPARLPPSRQSLGGLFVLQANDILAHYPDLQHSWDLPRRYSGWLTFPAEPDGFEVSVSIDPGQLIVFAGGGAHVHFDTDAPTSPPAAEVATEALGFIRDLLSPDMRLRELVAGRRAYRWILEQRTPDGWTLASATGLLFWNYLGSRSQRTLQNRQLPGRLRVEESSLSS